jgi:hypothetical protein
VRHIDVSGQRLAIFETDHSSALSGGSNRATVLFLNASPYRAIFHPYCIQDQDHIGATTILTRGGAEQCLVHRAPAARKARQKSALARRRQAAGNTCNAC